jgi:acetyltransferase
MMKITGATGVLLQPMLKGLELFAGIKRDEQFGHLILFGMGGIFIEVLKDVVTGMAPIGPEEAEYLISKLKSIKILEGTRGQKGINMPLFIEIITRLSALVDAVPEIFEMDLNPLIASGDELVAVDARIRLEA